MSKSRFQQMIDAVYEVDVINGLPVPQANARDEATLFNVNCASIFVYLFDGKVKVSVFSNGNATLSPENLKAFAYHLTQASRLEEYVRMSCSVGTSLLYPEQGRLFNR